MCRSGDCDRAAAPGANPTIFYSQAPASVVNQQRWLATNGHPYVSVVSAHASLILLAQSCKSSDVASHVNTTCL